MTTPREYTREQSPQENNPGRLSQEDTEEQILQDVTQEQHLIPLENTHGHLSQDTPVERNGSQCLFTEWPERRSLKRCKPTEFFLSVLAVLISLLLVAYIIVIIASNGRSTERIPGIVSFLSQFSNLSPTIMPILFAFIVGRAIKSIAHWRFQQGERIGLLDLLYGSTTVVGTVSTMFDTGEFGLVALVLVVTWIFSPLGSQSALRVVSFRSSSEVSFKTLPYFSSDTEMPIAYKAASIGAYSGPVIASFLTSLGAPNSTTKSALDTWGNVKVPIIEQLPGYKGKDSTEWISIDSAANGSHAPVYSSLIGIPVAALPADQNTTFSIEASYLNLECDELEMLNSSGILAKAGEIYGLIEQSCKESNSSDCGANHTMSWGEIATIPYPEGNANASLPRCSDPNPSSRAIFYVGYDRFDATYSRCFANTTYVEMKVKCMGWDCVPTAIRPSMKDNPSSNHTFFDGRCKDSTQLLFAWYAALLNRLTQTLRVGGSSAVSILQAYMINPDTALNTTAMYEQPGVWTLDRGVFALRFAQILNTFWLGTAGTEAVFLGHPPNYDSLKGNIRFDTKISNSNATVETAITRVHCDYRWMAALILSTLLLLVAAVVSVLLDFELRTPRMLMNVTTLTRGRNEAFFLPRGGGGLPDETRGKLMRALKVRFGEVECNEPHDLGIGVCVESGGNVSMVGKKRPVKNDW